MKVIQPFSRRVMLRGVGASLSLPLLESIGVEKGVAADATTISPPKRLMFLSYSWGVAKQDWFPTEAGANYTLPKCLEPLARHKADFSVLSNLSNKRATAGHHACTTWMTSADGTKITGANPRNSVSVDQIAAQKLGAETRFSSLELSGKGGPGGNNGGYGPGLSMAWSLEGNPIAGETSPVALFDRLFGASEISLEERKYHLRKEQSVLDAVLADAKGMNRRISKVDQEKIEEYFQSVRDIEHRLSKAEEWLDRPLPKAPLARPEGKFKTSEEIKIMYDLMVAAIASDQSRVLSYRQPVEGLFKEAGFNITGHESTHCNPGTYKYEGSVARDRLQIELLAYLIDRLKDIKDPDGSSVFDNSIICYGSGISSGHMLRNTPTLVAGHGGGGMNQGKHYVYESEQTPLANLWLSLLGHVGMPDTSFADSDGTLNDLFS